MENIIDMGNLITRKIRTQEEYESIVRSMEDQHIEHKNTRCIDKLDSRIELSCVLAGDYVNESFIKTNEPRYIVELQAKDENGVQVYELRKVPNVGTALRQAKQEGGWTHLRIFAFREEIIL